MADAPKLRFWWKRIEGRSILTMPRPDWNKAVGLFGEPVPIDVRETPLANVAYSSSVVASIAHRFAPPTAEVAIYRFDPKDAPTPINQDLYQVWTDLGGHPRLGEMIAASTRDDANLRQYIDENVFLVKQDPSTDHWLSSVPSSVTALLKKFGR